MSRYCCSLWSVLLIASLGAAPAVGAEAWPSLPAEDGAIAVPAQEWPRQPGPRTIQVYVTYPGRQLANVTARTGLMLTLHNWGGTQAQGTADPRQLADQLDVVAIAVDYLQSGPPIPDGPAYDFGYFQALDALRALYAVHDGLTRLSRPFDRGRIFATGGSGGGNVTLMANKLAPRTFAAIIDLCGMARLSDDIAFGLGQHSTLNAGYRRDPASPNYLRPDEQEIRFVGNPGHLALMKQWGQATKIIVVHGTTDTSCPVRDAEEMAANMRQAGLDVEPHFLTDKDVDGKAVKATGHALGDRTQIVFRFARDYLAPEGTASLRRSIPSDFERRDEIRYPTSGGCFVISYAEGYPVGRFER